MELRPFSSDLERSFKYDISKSSISGALPTTIHILGSQGFLGRALQDVSHDQLLRCWSHRESNPYHHFNLLEPESWNSLLNSKPTHVILLSWPGLPNFNQPFHVTRNLPACLHLIEQLTAVGLKRLIVSGTCYEYGLQNGPLKEDLFTNPVNCYGIAKDCLRRLIQNLYADQQLQLCWARIFYPIGIGQNPSSLIPSLVQAIKVGEKIFPMSSGRQLRDFIDVQEVARQLVLLALHPHATGVYNIGSGLPVSVYEKAQSIVSMYSSNIELVRGVIPDRMDEPLAFWADTTKIRSLAN
jgi:dTDP-6-deoxy-L-talose 4-dehydrogenase (NAD+)